MELSNPYDPWGCSEVVDQGPCGHHCQGILKVLVGRFLLRKGILLPSTVSESTLACQIIKPKLPSSSMSWGHYSQVCLQGVALSVMYSLQAKHWSDMELIDGLLRMGIGRHGQALRSYPYGWLYTTPPPACMNSSQPRCAARDLYIVESCSAC